MGTPFQWDRAVSSAAPRTAPPAAVTNVYFPTPVGLNCLSAGVPYSSWSDRPWDDVSSGYSYNIPGPVTLNGFHTAALRTMLELRGDAAPGAGATPSSPHIFASLVSFPSLLWVSSVPGSDNPLQALFWPLFTLCLLPMMVYPLAHEKAERLHAMMSMAGLRSAPYFVAHYAYCVLLYGLLFALYVAVGYGVGEKAMRNTGWQLFLALFFSWAHAQAGFAMLIGSALRSPRNAAIASYMIIVIVAVASFLLTLFVTPYPSEASWVPFLGYARASFLILAYGGATVAPGSELSSALLITVGEGTAALLLALYLHAVLPGMPESSSGVVLHPLFPLHAAMRGARALARWAGGGGRGRGARPGGQSAASSINGSSGGVPQPQSGGGDPAFGYGDPAVAAERSAILAAAAGSGPSLEDREIIIAGLVKTYPLPAASAAAALGRQERWERRGALSHWSLRPLVALASWAVQGYYSLLDVAAYLLTVPSSEIAADGAAAAGSCWAGARPVRRAVDGLFLTVRRGEAMGFCGVNGAGKSTTINALSECVCVGGGSRLAPQESGDCQRASFLCHAVGQLQYDGGCVIVQGRDVRARATPSLGVCPQFDCVWA